MARKRRLPFDYFMCGRRFKNAQAVRGHRRHFRYPRLRREAEAEVGTLPRFAAVNNHSGSTLSERLCPSQGGEKDGMRRRPGPLSYDSRILLLDLEAALDQLKQTAGHFADWARELTRMNVAGQNANAQVWEQMHQALDEYLRDLDPMLALFRLNRGTMLRIYNSMRGVKQSWLAQRIGERRFIEAEPDGLDPAFRLELREEEAQLTRIVEYLKRLVAAAP